MILYIKKSKYFYFEIIMDNSNFFDFTSFNQKKNLLNKAIENLEHDITDVAFLVTENKYYNFFWEFTYDIHRDDGIKGTVADYYLLEIVKYINRKFKISKIIIECPLKGPIIKKLSELVLVDKKIPFKYFLNEKIRYQLGALKYLINYFLHALKSKKKTGELDGERKVFFLTDDFSTSRFKEFPGLLNNYKDVYFIDIPLQRVQKYSDRSLNLIKSYNLKLIIASFIKALQLHSILKLTLNRKKPRTIYSENLKKQSFVQTFYLLLRYKVLNRIFSIYRPQYLVVATTIGDPIKRMALAAARDSGVNTIVFSCRSALSYLRAEDRIIDLDFDRISNKFFADYFISLDKISYQHLIEGGVDRGIIFNYTASGAKGKVGSQIYADGLFLLFAHEQFNNELISLIESLYNKNLKFNNIYYREHPAVKISKDMLARLKLLNFSITSLSDYPWSEISFKNVIALTSNSTSGIDASSRGSSIIWLPFLTEHSTQFEPMMSAIGKTCHTKKEFYDFIAAIQNEEFLIKFTEKCNLEYNDGIFLKSDIDEFVKVLFNSSL